MGSSDGPFGSMSTLNGVDLQALAASGQLPPQSLASIQAATLGRATSKSTVPSPLVEQRNVFNFENPKLRFMEGQQQQNHNIKQVNLLHGVPTNMDSKQLATLHQSAVGNMNMHVHSQMSQSNSLLMQMVPSSVGQPQAIPSAVLGRNGIENIRGPQYTSVSQASTSADLSSQSTEFSEMKGSRGFLPNYDVISNPNQNRNQDWRLHDVGSNFVAPQHSNMRGGLDVLMQQQFSCSQKSGESSIPNIGQQLSFSASDRPSRNKSERPQEIGFQNGLLAGRFGQEDLMSVLFKQVDFPTSELDQLNHYS